MNFIIAICREYGLMGRIIGEKVAKKLDINFYDNALLIKASEKAGLHQSILANFDEKVKGFIIRDGVKDTTIADQVYEAQKGCIVEISETESAVIIGRTAGYILKDYKYLLRVFLHAPISYRIKAAVANYGVDVNNAIDVINLMDNKRKTFYESKTGLEWGNPKDFDLVIDASIGVDAVVDEIIAEVKNRFGA